MVYIGNWSVAYVRSKCGPICSDNVIAGNVSKIISESFATVGLTCTVRNHLMFARPCHSGGAFNVSAVNVIVQSPGGVSS